MPTMRGRKIKPAARQRILDKAEELFYGQGYQATGINQIIQESGVAKATFYSQFRSKDELCLSYVDAVSRRELAGLEAEIQKRVSPMAKYMAAIEVLEPWLVSTDFRGCAFLNMVPEVADFGNPIRQVGAAFYARYRELIESAVKGLMASQPDKYSSLKPAEVAQDYLTIFAGSIALCEIFHSIEPLRHGVRMVRKLVG